MQPTSNIPTNDLMQTQKSNIYRNQLIKDMKTTQKMAIANPTGNMCPLATVIIFRSIRQKLADE